jgi:hypothetical protein
VDAWLPRKYRENSYKPSLFSAEVGCSSSTTTTASTTTNNTTDLLIALQLPPPPCLLRVVCAASPLCHRSCPHAICSPNKAAYLARTALERSGHARLGDWYREKVPLDREVRV